MDVFFVISGFVVTPLILQIFADQASMRERLSNLRCFYETRFYRLAPALAVTLAISAILIVLLGLISDHQRFARQGIATTLLIGNLGSYKYSGGDYFSPNPNPLVHTWSLAVEAQIYILLPLVLILTLRNRRSFQRINILALGLISAISFLSFLFPAVLQPLYSRAGIAEVVHAEVVQFSFYSTIDRIWQFTIGGLGFLLLDRYQTHKWKISQSINFALFIILLIILFSPIHVNLKVSSILSSFFALIVILCKSLDTLPEILIKKLEWLGDRSYSIYLVHMPLLYLAKYSPMTQIDKFENRIVQSAIAVVASIILGAFSYSKIEYRYRNKAKSNGFGHNAIAVSLVLTFVIPLTLFASIVLGQKVHYWGLDKNIPQPPYAGYLDLNCERDSANGPPCTYANNGAIKSVLLLGDSHAGDVSQAVIDAARNVNWNSIIWTHSGCAFQVQDQEKNIRDICIKNNRKAVEWISENTPDAIIISQSVTPNLNLSELKDGLSTLKLIVPTILLIENRPIFPDTDDFMVQKSLFMTPYDPPKSFLLSEMELAGKNPSNKLAMWARANGLSTMDITPLFCNERSCSRFSNGRWLYRDSSHLSVAGAELMILPIENFLKQFDRRDASGASR